MKADCVITKEKLEEIRERWERAEIELWQRVALALNSIPDFDAATVEAAARAPRDILALLAAVEDYQRREDAMRKLWLWFGEPNTQRQELYCHVCDRYVQFDIDLNLNGNHVVRCPNCNHEHCRVVLNGRITDERWATRNRPVYWTANVTVSTTSWTVASASTTNTAVHWHFYPISDSGS